METIKTSQTTLGFTQAGHLAITMLDKLCGDPAANVLRIPPLINALQEVTAKGPDTAAKILKHWGWFPEASEDEVAKVLQQNT
jgi:hypothetical protein